MTPTIREVVNRIRSLLQSTDQTNSAEYAGWAASYADACQETNSRLGRCGEMLARGLRSEAVALAEAEPKLLEMVVVLDFPERGEWDQLALAYGLTGAQSLRIDLAEAVQDAYTEEESLDDLLRRHRLLAWGRAPLGERVEALRAIAQKDSTNPIWSDDLRAFKLELLKDFRREFDRLVAAKDLPGMLAAERRVEAEGWVAPPSPELVQHVRVSTARGRLESLSRQLARAFEAGDIANARTCRARWAEALPFSELRPPSPILDRAAPVLRWVEATDQREAKDRAYAEALAELEHAIEDGAGAAEFAECEAVALGFGRGLPPELHGRWEDYRGRLQGGRRRKRLIGAGLGAAALATIGGIALLFVVESRRMARVRDLAAVVEPLIQSDQLVQARALLDAYDAENPGAGSERDLASVRASLKSKEGKDQLRQAQLDSTLKRLEEAAGDPSKSSELLAASRKLARSPEEISRIDGAVDAIRKASEGRRADLEGRIGAALDGGIEPRLADLERIASRSLLDPAVEATLKELDDARPEGFAEAARWDSPLGERARDAISRLDSLRAKRRARLDRERLRGAVTEAVSGCNTPEGIGRYGDALAALLASLDPVSAQVRDLKLSLEKRLSAWESVAAWSETGRSWNLPATNPLPEEVPSRIQAAEAILKAFPEWQGAGAVRDYIALLLVMQVRESEARPRLDRLFRDKLVADVWWVKVEDKNKKLCNYYLPAPPPGAVSEPLAQFTIKYLIDFEGTRSRIPAMISSHNVQLHGRAPQVVMAERSQRILDETSGEKGPGPEAWERMIVGILRELRDPKHPEIDPILRWALISATVSRGIEGSDLLARSAAMAKLKKAIEQHRIDTGVRWMDPEEARAAPIRLRAADALPLLPGLDDILSEASSRCQVIEKGLADQWLEPVGWLTREEDGAKAWRCQAPRPIPEGSGLFVLSPTGLTIRVGDQGAAADRPAIKPDASGLEEGALVYVKGEARS
jgi:hypothetical protein